MTQTLYGVLFVVGFLDLLLVTPALRNAANDRERGRLVSTLLSLTGIVGLAGVRFLAPPPYTATATVFLLLVDFGFLGYALTLPHNGLLQLLDRWRRRRKP